MSPSPKRHGWKPPHPFLIFILFFCPSVLFFCFRSLCVYVLISPTPLLCHQLGPSVSKSWSHCACLAFIYLFCLLLLTNMYAWTFVAFHKHIYCILTYISTINLWLPSRLYFSFFLKWFYHCLLFKKRVVQIHLVDIRKFLPDLRSDIFQYGSPVKVTGIV